MHVSPAHTRTALIALLLLSVAPFFLNLGASSLWDSNEAFYAETPREMIEADDYLNPSFNYKPRFNKPPFCYWVVATSYHLFGVSEAAERLPLALGAAAMVATAFVLGRLIHSTEAGLLAALALATVPRFLMFSRRIIIDVYIAMFMGLTLMLFALAEKYPERRRFYLTLMYASIGFGILTKGPVAAALPALAFLIYLAAGGRLLTLRRLMLPAGALIVALIVLPWYVAIYSQHGWHYITSFIFQDNISRYTQPVWGPRRGPLFYLPVLLGDLFPWSLFFFAGLFAVARPPVAFLFRRLRQSRQRPTSPASPVSGHERLLLIWIGTIVVFYSLSSNKEDLYISPVYTAVAALVGVWLARALFAEADGEATQAATLRPAAVLAGLLIGLVGAAVFYLFAGEAKPYDLRGAAAVAGLATVGGVSILAFALLRQRFAAIVAVAAVCTALNWVFVLRTLPDFERYKPVRALCETIRQEAGEDARVGYYRIASPSMVFYLRRQIFEYYKPEELIETFQSPGEVYCILSADDYAAMRESLPATTRILASRPLFQVKLRTIFSARADRNEAKRELPHVVLIANR